MSQPELLIFGAILACSFCLSLQLAEAQITYPSEVDALRAIRSSLIDPLDKLKSWNHGDPCASNWTGINCYNSTFRDGYLHVQEL